MSEHYVREAEDVSKVHPEVATALGMLRTTGKAESDSV